MKYAGTVCELGGLAAISFGAYQLAPWLAWVVGGGALIFISQAIGGKPS